MSGVVHDVLVDVGRERAHESRAADPSSAGNSGSIKVPRPDAAAVRAPVLTVEDWNLSELGADT